MQPQDNRPNKLSKRQSYKVHLSEQEHEMIMTRMPKNYALVEAKDWAEYIGALQYQRIRQQQAQRPDIEHSRAMNIVEKQEESIAVVELQPPMQIEVGRSEPAAVPTSSTTKKQEQERRKSKDKHHKSTSDPKSTQQDAIMHLLSRITNHSEFPAIRQAKMNPTAEQLLDLIKSKLGKEYGLVKFKEDIKELYQIFYKVNGHNKRVSVFQDLAMNNINKYLKKFGHPYEFNPPGSQSIIEEPKIKSKIQQPIQNPILAPVQKSIQRQIQKPIQRPIEQIKEQPRHQEPIRERPSPFQQPHSYQSEPSDQNIKTRLRRDPIQTPIKSEINLIDMATLGFNIRKLTSQGLKWICINFITGPKDRSLMKNSTFNLDLETLSSEQFWKLENFVKRKLEFAGVRYEKLPPQEDDDFMIEDDSEESDE